MIDSHLADAFAVIGGMVRRPTFADLDQEREVVLEEIAMYEDDPQERVFDVLGEAVFGKHPLGRILSEKPDGDAKPVLNLHWRTDGTQVV